MKISQKRKKDVGEVQPCIIWFYSMFLRRGLILYLRLALNLKSSCFRIWMHESNFYSPLASEVIGAYYRLSLAMTQESPLSKNEQHGEDLHEGLTLERIFAFVNAHHTGDTEVHVNYGFAEDLTTGIIDSVCLQLCEFSSYFAVLSCQICPQHCIVFF